MTPRNNVDVSAIKGGESNGCPRCGGAVFEAEKVMEKGKAYHKRCFTCVTCNRPQEDKLQVLESPFLSLTTSNKVDFKGLHWTQ